LLRWTLGLCAFIFSALELWRPCFFFTDDNLAYWFPLYTEMGRRMKAGQSPFVSDYLFGGGYNYLRDLNVLRWHPFMIGPSFLADSSMQFWMIDISAFFFLMLATAGFVLLACRLRDELSLKIPGIYIVFYTLSFVFSSYALRVGSSWIDFLGIESSLPWLALGILERRLLRSLLLITVVTLHELLSSFAPMVVTSALCLTLLAVAVGFWRRSFQPIFSWLAGTTLAVMILSPLLLLVMDGFAHTVRLLGLPLRELYIFSVRPDVFAFSFFLGNWSDLVTYWLGDVHLKTQTFPFVGSILACAAAGCTIPALVIGPWRFLDKACIAIILIIALFVMRPHGLAVAMHHLPFFRSMRWPFRESLQLLFFIHVLLVLRFPARLPRAQAAISLISLALFLLPLPFIRVPTLNHLAFDRRLLFSGQAQEYWASVKPLLKPSDEIVVAMDWSYWNTNAADIPYTLLGAANFPEYFRVRSASAYAPTAPVDQLPLKTIPSFWFGAFSEDQMAAVLAEKPDLKVLRILSTHPLKITLSEGTGNTIDLTPLLLKAGIKAAAPAPPADH